MMLENLNSPMQKNETGPGPYTRHTSELKMDEILICEKGIHQNPDSNLPDIVQTKVLQDIFPKASETIANMNYWVFMRINRSVRGKKSRNINTTNKI